jgi:glucoside 3-dehydrogenase (cytochrome c) catalytic subunit
MSRGDAPFVRRQEEYDAIVVGSGMTGGWAAKELTEAGLRTLVLEAGPMIVPSRDYVEHVPPYGMPFRGYNDRKALEAEQPVQRECYACDEMARKFFVNDIENPYSTPDDAPFKWIRGRHVGGRSIMWARQTYRWSDIDFEANLREGVGVDWPIRYADLEPWYDRVSTFVGISGRREGLPQLPDGPFLPPMDMSCVEEVVRDGIASHFGGRRMMTIGRCAVLTEDHNGRSACHYCGPCHRGCRTRSYFSSLNATLPAAEATGRMTLRPDSVVHSVIWDAAKGRVTGVRVIDRETREPLEFFGRIVFLGASTLESTRILLHSTSADFPDGLANSSGALGRYLMDHTMGVGATATFPGWEAYGTYGQRPNGIYIPRFRNVTEPTPDFLRGYGYQGGTWRAGWDRGASEPGFGAGFKRSLIEEQGPWMMGIGAFGECLPSESNYVELDPELEDAWGIPALRIHCRWGDNERAMMEDAADRAVEMLEAAGGRDISRDWNPGDPGLTIHEMGTARMGRDPKTSVLNGFNQSWDAPNLFVIDGAAMPSTACQNPSLTYMALTARACAYAVESSKRGEL